MKHLIHRSSIFSRLLPLILSMVVFQAAVYLFVFWQGGVLSHINQNAVDLLSEQTYDHQQYLENEMTQRWSDLAQSEHIVLETFRTVMQQYDVGPGATLNDTEIQEAMIRAAAPELLYLLYRNQVTGAYLILDGPADTERTGNRAGFYIRDQNLEQNDAAATSLAVMRGSVAAAADLGIPLSENWSPGFFFTGIEEEEAFFYRPLQACRQGTMGSSDQYAYWSPAFLLDGETVITYSLPLVLDDTCLGILGIELSCRYLDTQMTGLGGDGNTYFLGTVQENGQYLPMAVSGGLYTTHFDGQQTLTGQDTEYMGIRAFESRKSPGTDLYGSVRALSLYDSGSAFADEQWVLIGMQEKDTLFAFTHRIQVMLYTSTAISLVAGILGALWITRTVEKPLKSLVEELQASDPAKPVHLPKIHVQEIDELTSAIETMSKDVAQFSSKISTILTATKVQIGVFEGEDGRPSVFCSRELFGLLNWPTEKEGDQNLPIGEFQSRMRALEDYRYEQDKPVYRLPDEHGTFRFIAIHYMENGARFLGAVTDISRDMLEKQRIEYERDFDVLTNLYNYQAFLFRVRQLFSSPEQLKTAAMLMWDLDNLKYVNDTYGHEWGDRYLNALSSRLQEFQIDGGIVARRSGDEFYVFLYGFQSKEPILEIVHRVWEHIQEDAMTAPDGDPLKIRVSAGIAWYPEDAVTLDDLLRCSDYAMYSSKNEAKGTLRGFNPDQYDHEAYLIHGQEALNLLIEHELVEYVLQPIVQVSDASIYGYELLMRPQIKELSTPHDVLSIARAQSKLYQIEALTWKMALAKFAACAEQGILAPGAHAFINSIGNQIVSASEWDRLGEQYRPYLHRIVMEMTENEASNRELLQEKIERMKAWGGQIAVDDFGAGYNSEQMAVFLNPSLVKVDRSLIRGIHQDSNRQAVLMNWIVYARERGIGVLAEGVETEEEMELVIRFGVDYLQGYYLAPPSEEPVSLSEERKQEILTLYRRYTSS